MKTYIGWDVGIKNLSYCIIDEKFNIIDWNVINLLGDRDIPLCLEINGKGNECNKKASYFDISEINNKNRKYYCKTHSKKIKEVKEVNNCFYCSKISKYELENSICVCEKHSKNKEIINKIYNKTDKISLEEIGTNMINKLNSNPLFLEVSGIVIENQPVLKNPRMKSIQMILYSYFLIKFNDHNINVKINLVPANSKLKFNIKNDEIEKINEIKNKYMKGKKLAIEYCRHFIKDTNDKLIFFNNFSKKDDLADSYLLIRKFLVK
jgi:hypothetical protein